MLGLGGLTYDQGEAELSTGGSQSVQPATGGQPPSTAGGDGDLNLGGAPEETPPDSFSILLDRDSLIAASPFPRAFADYFIFDPGKEELSFLRQDGYRSIEIGAWDFPAPEGLTHLRVVPFDGGMTVMGYDSVSGYTSQAIVGNDGEFEFVSTDVGTSGRTALISFFADGVWLALAYSASDGNYRYFRPAPAEEGEVFAGEWEPGWTGVAPFSVGSDVGVLKFDESTGKLQFDRLTRRGEPFETMLELVLPKSFSHMQTFLGDEAGRRTGVVLYQQGSGEVVTGKLTVDGSGVEFVQEATGYFRGDLTQIVPLSSIQKAFAFTFSATSGQAVLRDLSPLGDLGIPVIR